MWSRFPLCPIPPKEMEGPSTRVDKRVAIAVQRAHKMKGNCGFYLMQFLLGQPREHCPIWDWCIWATNQTSNVSFALNHNVMKFGKKTCNTQKLGKCSLGVSKHHKLQSKAWVTCNVNFNYLIGNWTSGNHFILIWKIQKPDLVYLLIDVTFTDRRKFKVESYCKCVKKKSCN
jgi:hypothetical protein